MESKLETQGIQLLSINGKNSITYKCSLGHISTIHPKTVNKAIHENRFICKICNRRKNEVRIGVFLNILFIFS